MIGSRGLSASLSRGSLGRSLGADVREAGEPVFDDLHAVHQRAQIASETAAEPQFAGGVERSDDGADREPGVDAGFVVVTGSLGDDGGELPVCLTADGPVVDTRCTASDVTRDRRRRA
jgi:hypothetical protein